MVSSDYHVHSYGARTSCANGHIHWMCGVTGPSIPMGLSHVHYYNGITTFDQGHVHCFRGCTGPSIPCPGGGHVHCMNGCTSIDHYHSHYYNSYTGNEESSMLFQRKAL
jgi:hypothetical protein